jgi:protoporphyrin/coproporphyrin ferrochelatase
MTEIKDRSSTFAASQDRLGVLLMAHGAPDRLDDIPEFLLNVRGGRPLPEPAVQEIAHRYAAIGGGSPLLLRTRRQAEALSQLLGLPVYVGMRNWKPFIAEALERVRREGVKRLMALCMAPQNSRTSTGLYRKMLEEARASLAPELETDFIESWHDHPGLIAAFVERLNDALARIRRLPAETGLTDEPIPVVFTAHSVPEQSISDGDPYLRQVGETAALVAQAARVGDYRLAFQSQGMTREAWNGPTVESQIDELSHAGRRHVLLAPIGFVSDHVEILYDVDVAFRRYGEGKGVKVHRTESLNDSALFIQALAEIVTARLAAKVR